MRARRAVGDDGGGDESFAPTSGTFVGWLVIGVALCVAALGLRDGVDGFGPAAVAAALFASVFAWLTLLRPRVLLQGDDVVLRQSLSTTRIPLDAVEEVSVRHVLEIRAHDQRYQTAAIGHPRRQLMRGAAPTTRRDEAPAAPRLGEVHWADHVEAKLRRASLEARARTTGVPARPVRRSVDVVPALALGLVLVAVAATVIF